jgi:hypothetical protein
MKVTKNYLKHIIKEELNKLEEVDPVPPTTAPAQNPTPAKQEGTLKQKIIEVTKDVASTPLGTVLRKGNSDLERALVLLEVLKNVLSDVNMRRMLIDKYSKPNTTQK